MNWDRKSEGYAQGELIAEMGACFLMAELGLATTSDLTNHAAYLKHWLKGMEDPKFIFQAASQANKAVEFLMAHAEQPVQEREPAIVV